MKKQIITILPILLLINPVQASELNIDKLDGSSLFLQQEERNIDYQLLTGEAELREETEEFTEGYYARTSIMIEGEMTREIYDFKKEYSSFQINESLTALLNNNDYTVLFTCQKIECGEIVAWSHLVSSYIAGSEGSQRVVAAKKVFKNLEIGYVFYHLADIEGEPRLVIDYIETLPIDNKQNSKSVPLALTFKNNSTNISELNVIILDKVADVIKMNAEKKYIVTGHTDNIGSAEHNEQLSIERADAIKNYLVDKYDILPDLILSKGVGTTTPKNTNGTALGRKANRRAEITLL
ncbi:OmpA family protein [Shewanella frigidimarina]|uniref:OmpA family protein n=1 Tax=Shewanella frigidimarina TaxID=56812 RepID=UPI00316E1B6F